MALGKWILLVSAPTEMNFENNYVGPLSSVVSQVVCFAGVNSVNGRML